MPRQSQMARQSSRQTFAAPGRRLLAKSNPLCYDSARYAPVGELSAPSNESGGKSRGKEVNRLVRSYELVFIVHPEVDGDDFTAVVEQVTDLIERNSGKVTEVNNWGLRRLAYPIQDQWEGQYVFMLLELEPHGVIGLERSLILVEQVIRYLIVRPE